MRRRIQILMMLVTVGLSLWAPNTSMASTEPAVSSYCFEHDTDDGRPRASCIALGSYTADVCAAIGRDAEAWNLPRGYFARLIWQESHFDANAISGAGAEGIAQFMPATGRNQGLANPYNPAEELWRSARYLATLHGKFGNLGLAAAAYNGGENRVARFIAGTGYLAAETLNYVETITGVPVTDWLADDVPDSEFALDKDTPFQDACVALARSSRLSTFTPPTAIVQPWGIQLAQFFSQANARRAYDRLQKRHPLLGDEELMLVGKRNPNFGRALRFTVEIGRASRAEAQTLCTALVKAGGACLVVKN